MSQPGTLAGLWWDSFLGPTSNSVIPGESEDLASRLQSSRQRVGELERTLSAVSTQQKQVDKVSPAADPSTGGAATLTGEWPEGPFCTMGCLAAQKAARAISRCFKVVWLLKATWG